jgi:hypothetical protein
MEVRPLKGLVFVWMVQHQGYPGQGAKARGVFVDAVLKGR